jgi:predicted metal-binding membrane protein
MGGIAMTTISTDRAEPVHRLSQGGVAVAVLVLAGSAWVVLALTHGTALDHHRLGLLTAPADPAAPAPAHAEHMHSSAPGHGLALGPALLVVAGWAVMTVAMMLPPALPLVHTLHRLVSRRRARWALLAAGVAAFVAVWAVAGVVLLAGDAALNALARSWHDLSPAYVTAAVLAGAGVYQLSPLKAVCLRACRSPRSFALAHWRGRRPAALELVTVSGTYALVCVGCCWALMAVTLAVAVAALPVMVVLAAVMAAERLVSWGRRLVIPIGIALLILGALTAFELLPVAPPLR